MSHHMLTTRGGNRPRWAGSTAPKKKAVAKSTTAKDEQQDREISKLKRIVAKPEMKYTDTLVAGGSGFTMVTAGNIFGLNFMGQGLQPLSRVGNQIRCRFVRLQGYVVIPAGYGTDRLVRLALVWDKSPSGANPTIFANTASAGMEAIFDSNSTGLGVDIPNVFAAKSMECKDRFHVIKDKLIHCRLEDPAIEVEVPFKLHAKLNRVTRFINTTATIGSLMTNGLFFVANIDNVTVSNVTCNFTSRVYFTDD